MKKRIIIYFVLVILFFFFNFYFRPVSGNPLVTDEYKKSSSYINDLYYSDEYFKKKILKKSEYYIYDAIIEGSLNNKTEVSINCLDNCSESFTNAYYAVYLDHPELISFFGIGSYKIAYGKLTYHNYQKLGSFKTFFGTRRIERELDIIRNETKNMSEKDKIIYVYDYVASHNYDRLFTFIGTNQSAYSFFTKGSSVCAGFAKASQLIFQNIGIKSYLVLSVDHMWNYVEYKGKYYVFDATVGASFSDKKYEYYYDGLGKTTIEDTKGLFTEYYPPIEEKELKYIFGL